jgi:hypothetical protein
MTHTCKRVRRKPSAPSLYSLMLKVPPRLTRHTRWLAIVVSILDNAMFTPSSHGSWFPRVSQLTHKKRRMMISNSQPYLPHPCLSSDFSSICLPPTRLTGNRQTPLVSQDSYPFIDFCHIPAHLCFGLTPTTPRLTDR